MVSQNVPNLTSGILNRIWPHTRNRKTGAVSEISGRMGSPPNASSCVDEFSLMCGRRASEETRGDVGVETYPFRLPVDFPPGSAEVYVWLVLLIIQDST